MLDEKLISDSILYAIEQCTVVCSLASVPIHLSLWP